MTDIVTIVCDKCGNEFDLSSVDILTEQFTKDGEEFSADYFVCGKCKTPYVNLVRDEKFNKIKSDIDAAKRRYKRQKGMRNESLMNAMLKTIKVKEDRLRSYGQRLQAKFPGSFVLVSSEGKDKLVYQEKLGGK